MTVRDLIIKLKQFDEDTEVMIKDAKCRDCDCGGSNFEIIDAEYSGYGGRVVDLVVVDK